MTVGVMTTRKAIPPGGEGSEVTRGLAQVTENYNLVYH